ncbi:triose-phosphate transporter family-domain-containing protein [Roridomyces roridus]|uniref:Triose-phosphate transporter family-domain-containing protein n=1 Tax=Roridomyces roridus TaxID=1738132 RepID=A0AAD7FM68_9AGAR|nr:triose-phosphate transporter family-domain-containing protein [Roridomyces roridus]
MSTARHCPKKPLLPTGLDLASNATIHSFKIPPQRLNLKSNKENYTPNVSWHPATTRRRPSLLQQRAYHHEPYPPAFSSNKLRLPPCTPKTAPSHCSVQLPESPAFWLAMYFCFNLGLTLYNKGVLLHFPFPYTLSALHALFGTIGGSLLVKYRCFVPSRPSPQKVAILLAFSLLYALNIAVSNVSLQLVTVPFHQVVRAATPIFTIFFSGLLLDSHSSRARKISLIPVVAGVGFATFGDYYFTFAGFLLTLFGTVLAALKTIFTNLVQARKAKPHAALFNNPLELLYFLSPLAFIQCALMAYLTGELALVRHCSMTGFEILALLVNGCFAFGLNIVSFGANRRVGALGMTVAANVKQVLTVVCAVVIFDLTITPLNGLGIGLTLVGGAWYALIELGEKQRARNA